MCFYPISFQKRNKEVLMPVMCTEQPLNTHAHTRVHNVIDELAMDGGLPKPLAVPARLCPGPEELGAAAQPAPPLRSVGCIAGRVPVQ